MLKKETFIFDSRSCNWTNDSECNMAFIKAVETYLNNLIHVRGYLYLNQIFEALGLPWDPLLMKNECYTFPNHIYVETEPIGIKNSFNVSCTFMKSS